MNDFISPHNKIEEWAQAYITNVDCSTHEKAQITETTDLIKKTCEFTSVEKMAEVIAILLDANRYRTMDIMGIVQYLVCDVNLIEL